MVQPRLHWRPAAGIAFSYGRGRDSTQRGVVGAWLPLSVFLPLGGACAPRKCRPCLVVAMELLDDVQFDQDGSPQELVQLKHHVNAQGDLSDVSVDLWRTINVWISVITELSPDEHPNLTLVTTTTAPAGSACTYLRADEHRDVSRAAARSSGLRSRRRIRRLRPGGADSCRLAPSQREALVDAITVADGAATIDALDDLLKEALFWVLPGADRADTFITYVKGWWLGIAIKLLRRELTAFAATDMLNAIQDIRDQLGPGAASGPRSA